MKKILLSFLVFITISASSQSLVLTQAFNEPTVGDTDLTFAIDTSAFTTGLPIGITGTNCAWNYQNLAVMYTLAPTAYVSPATVTNAASFPGCTMVQSQAGIFTFLKSTATPTTQTEIMGITTSTLSLNFTNTAVAAKYPVSYGSSQTDNLGGSFTFSVTGTCSGSITTSADGVGTLNLPNNMTLTNVLRVKSVQSVSLSASLFPPLPATQVGSIKQTIYNYYHASQKFPIISVSYQHLSLITSSTPTVSGSVTGNRRVIPTSVGLKEHTFSQPDLEVYPNPFTSGLTIDMDQLFTPKDVKLYTQLGQLVYQKEYAANIDLSNLPAGIYFIEVKTEQGTARKKMIKE